MTTDPLRTLPTSPFADFSAGRYHLPLGWGVALASLGGFGLGLATVPFSLAGHAVLKVARTVGLGGAEDPQAVELRKAKGVFPAIEPQHQAKTTPLSEREFDVVVFGATGFVGQLCVEYLAVNYPTLKWAIAARRVDAATKLRDELAEKLNKPALKQVPCIKAAANDAASLRDMCARTRVVITAAGPYQLYGTPVVKAAIECGTSTCDITGEVDWVRGLVENYDKAAREAGSLIVSFCGNDSIPWDMSVCALASKLGDEKLRSVVLYDEAVGSVSGGTLATVFESVPPKPYKGKLGFDPLLLKPDGTASSSRVKDRNVVLPASSRAGVLAPFFMAPVNMMVVRRSNALNEYGTAVTYREGLLQRGWGGALGILFGILALGPVLLLPGSLKYAFIPRPGQGASREELERNWLQVTGVATGERGTRVGSRLFFPKDSGYLDTARMLCECALAIALERDRMRMPTGGGVVTPGAAHGNLLLERLVKTGCKFAWMGEEELRGFD